MVYTKIAHDKQHQQLCRPIFVMPLFKKGGKSKTTMFSKYYFFDNDIIRFSQHIFQKGQSTESALLHIKTKLIKSVESWFYTLGIFPGLSESP